MFITSFGEQNITYKCCSNFLIHLYDQPFNISENKIYILLIPSEETQSEDEEPQCQRNRKKKMFDYTKAKNDTNIS